MNRLSLICILGMILPAACGNQSTPVLSPNLTNMPFLAMEPESLSPTPAFRLIDIKSGGFSLHIHPDLEFDIDNHSINLSDTQNKLLMSLNGRTYIASEYTTESFLEKYIMETASRGGAFIQSTPYEIIIDDMTESPLILQGYFLVTPSQGRHSRYHRKKTSSSLDWECPTYLGTKMNGLKSAVIFSRHYLPQSKSRTKSSDKYPPPARSSSCTMVRDMV